MAKMNKKDFVDLKSNLALLSRECNNLCNGWDEIGHNR